MQLPILLGQGDSSIFMAGGNGWRNPCFTVEELKVESAFISSMHTFKADALSWEGGGELIAVGTSDGIEVRPQ